MACLRPPTTVDHACQWLLLFYLFVRFLSIMNNTTSKSHLHRLSSYDLSQPIDKLQETVTSLVWMDVDQAPEPLAYPTAWPQEQRPTAPGYYPLPVSIDSLARIVILETNLARYSVPFS